MNRIFIMGRLCADPDFKSTQSGISICKVRVAVNRPAKSGEPKQADFFPVTCWGRTAEIVNQYFRKGGMIAIEGRVRNNDYTDRSGVKHYAFEVTAENVHFCGENQRNQTHDVQLGDRNPADTLESLPADELPF